MSMKNDDRINALAALYAAERADLSSMTNQLLGVSSLAVTYIVAIFIVLGHTKPDQRSFVWFAAPIPVFVFLAFYVLFISVSIARTASCKKLEAGLAGEAGVNAEEIGIPESDRITDIKQASPLYKGLILAAYVPVILGSLLVTVYLLVQAFHHDANTLAQVGFTIIYVILFVLIALGWVKVTFGSRTPKGDRAGDRGGAPADDRSPPS